LERESFGFGNAAAEGKPAASGIALDYKRILFRALRLWYVIVISVACGLIIAKLINRYTTPIYPITSSIIIREPAENTDARFIYNNSLVNSYRNFFNEPYIIRSYPLVQSVIESLNFQVKIQKEGNFKTTEKYTLPLEIDLIGKRQTGSITLEILKDGYIHCYGDDKQTSEKYRFGDTINCSGLLFKVRYLGDASVIEGEKYKVSVSDPMQVARNYISKLKVTWAQQGSSVVNLDINGPIPQKEIDFLNELIRHYQRYDLEKKNQAASRSLIFIEDQLKDIGDSLQYFENALESFKKQNFVTDLTLEAQTLYDELKAVGEQKSVIQFSANYYNYLDQYLREQKDYTQVILPSGIGVSDAVLNTMVTQLVTLQTELNLVPLSKDRENPMLTGKAKKLQEALQDVREQIKEAIKTLRSTDKIKIKGLNAQIARLEAKLRTLPAVQRRLVNLQRNYTFSENLYTFLQQKKAEAGISKASTTTDIIIVNTPRVAGEAITPKTFSNYIAYGAAGLFLPLLIFALIEIVNNRIQSKEDIEKITSIPFIGGIGHNPTSSNLVVYEKPKSAMAESFRALRSNLNYFTEGKDKKIFMVTSSLSGEGKSFTTINLATVFSLAGKKTIIIGADLRKPKIFDDFGLGNDKGLSVYLSGLVSLENIIQQTSIENLDIISGGPVPPNPSELLLNSRMDELIQKLKAIYDFILIDTPPLAIITDGLVLAKYADHTVFIVRQNYTPRAVLRTAGELYAQGKIRNLSLVLNDVFRTGPGYGYAGYGYRYGYGYGYGYGSRDKKGDGGGYYSED
jgi:capsular exopolysaccharide synthesis family protein